MGKYVIAFDDCYDSRVFSRLWRVVFKLDFVDNTYYYDAKSMYEYTCDDYNCSICH